MTNTKQHPAQPVTSKLTFHAVERIMERSMRAPSWLADVLNRGEFAHLAFANQNEKRFVLVFDALTDTYLVPVLPAKARTVITVLTQAQYEQTHGAIAPVLFQLAQLARRKGLEPPAPETDEDAPHKRLAKKQAKYWNGKWRAVLAFRSPKGRRDKVRLYLDARWRQECISAEFQKSATDYSAETVPAELPFDRQVVLLGRSPGFLVWLVQKMERLGEDLDDLHQVTVLDNASRMFDITPVLIKQLRKQVMN